MSRRQQSTGCIEFPNPRRYLNLLRPSLLNSKWLARRGRGAYNSPALQDERRRNF
jgi:hypothetical protein